MKLARKLLIIDAIMWIIVIILEIIFSSVMSKYTEIFVGGILIFNWFYLKVHRAELKKFYYDYYDGELVAKLVFWWSIFVSYLILLAGIFMMIKHR